jgi:cholesterol transport system auxiliary component
MNAVHSKPRPLSTEERAMNTNECRTPRRRAFMVLASVVLLAGCSALPPPQTESANVYLLEAATINAATRAKRDLVLAVGMPRAGSGFDTPQMVYVRQPHELNYFVANRWADAPARMLEPVLVRTLEQAGSFRAVVPNPGAVPADLRLDTELVRLQQDFSMQPSRLQITLRAQLIDVRSRRVLATRLFDESETAPSDDAYGGVTAANRALQRVLEQLADFCAAESGGR